MERIFGSSSTLTKPNQTSETPSFDALLKQETGSIEDASCSPSTLLKAEQITTGEEDDVMISSYRAKLFSLVNDVWKERGKGSLKLNKSAFIHRLVMRQEVTGRLILNVGCFNDMVGNVEDCWVRFAGVEEDGLVRFLVKVFIFNSSCLQNKLLLNFMML